LGRPVDAFYGLYGDGQTAVIEMVAASGLVLLTPAERDPLRTITFGTGELTLAALNAGARRFLIAMGGSATNDGGAGMARALGASFLDEHGNELPFCGGALQHLARIDAERLDRRLRDCQVDVACDVDNTLTGPQGASAVFGPQKGATPEVVARLDGNLARYAELIRLDVGVAVEDVPGDGAAGGLGAGLLAFLKARLRPGIDIVADALGLDRILAGADLVITGEGRIDGQTVHGKTPIGVARIAKRRGKPVIGIAGCLTEDAIPVYASGIGAIFSVLSSACTKEQALAAGATDLRLASRNIAAAIRVGYQLNGK
jgi:glycerate kinase